MRLIIADEVLELIKQYKNELQRLKANQLVKCGVNQVEKFIKDEDIIPTVLTIPNNPTNGDVIRMMFPNAQIDYHENNELVEDCVTVYINGCDICQDYPFDWWNAPYKKEA